MKRKCDVEIGVCGGCEGSRATTLRGDAFLDSFLDSFFGAFSGASVVAVAFFVTLLMTAQTTRADEIAMNLRPNFVEGQTSRYEIWSRRDTLVSMAFGTQENENGYALLVDGEISWTVDKVRADGSAVCTMMYDWIVISLVIEDGDPQPHDSRQGSGNVATIQSLVDAVAGKPMTVEVAADGTIESLKGVEKIERAAGEGASVPSTEDFIESAGNLAMLWAAPDSEKTKPGTTWKTDLTWPRDEGDSREKTTYTVGEVEVVEGLEPLPVVTIVAETEMSLTPDLSKLPKGPNAPKVDIRQTVGEGESQIMFDLERREVIGRNVFERRRVETSFKGPQNQTITRAVETTLQSQALRIAEE